VHVHRAVRFQQLIPLKMSRRIKARISTQKNKGSQWMKMLGTNRRLWNRIRKTSQGGNKNRT
jgi:hypothetical protein